jgi:hypothetical protein
MYGDAIKYKCYGLLLFNQHTWRRIKTVGRMCPFCCLFQDRGISKGSCTFFLLEMLHLTPPPWKGLWLVRYCRNDHGVVSIQQDVALEVLIYTNGTILLFKCGLYIMHASALSNIWFIISYACLTFCVSFLFFVTVTVSILYTLTGGAGRTKW